MNDQTTYAQRIKVATPLRPSGSAHFQEDMSARRSTTEYDVKQQRREKEKSAKTKKIEARELGMRMVSNFYTH